MRYLIYFMSTVILLSGCTTVTEDHSSSEGSAVTDVGKVETVNKVNIEEMSDQEIREHFEQHAEEYNTYGDFIEENMKMIEFSMEQFMIGVTALKNSGSGFIDQEFQERYEKGINTTSLYIEEARQLQEIPLFVGDIHRTYLLALDQFEETIEMMESKEGRMLDLEVISAMYKSGTIYLEETVKKMEELNSRYNRIVTSEEGNTNMIEIEDGVPDNQGLGKEIPRVEDAKEAGIENLSVKESQEGATKNSSINDTQVVMDVRTYFPLQVGYQYNFSYVMDSVGEAIQIIGQYENRYLATGDQGGMVGFYRIYEIENNEVYIVSTYLEDDEEYHMIAEYVVNFDFSFLEKMQKDHSQESPVLRWPLKDGDTFGKAVVMDTDRTIQLNGQEYEALVVRYKGVGEEFTEYYYAKDYGLIRMVLKNPIINNEPMLIDDIS